MTRTPAPLSPEVLDFACRAVAGAAGATGPVATADILPPEMYTASEFWEFEKAAIFSKEWLCIGHASEVPTPGDQLPVTILDEPLIMLRDESGDVRVLSAICQHRGHPIFAGLGRLPAENNCVSSSRLTCPYHNWVYRLDGALIAAPAMNETTPLETLRATIRLPEIRSEIFHGMVFVNFDENAAPLTPTLSKLDAELATYGIEDLVAVPAPTRTDLPWNWKMHHENALEPYHTDYVHRNVHDSAPSRLARFEDYEVGDGQVMHPTYLVSEEADLATFSGNRVLATLPGLGEEQRKRILFASIPPLLFGIFQPTFVSLSLIQPTGPTTIDLRRLNLYPKTSIEAEGFEEYYQEQLLRKQVAIDQDQVTLMAMMDGYKSRFVPAGTLSFLETPIPQMNSWLMERYTAALAGMEA